MLPGTCPHENACQAVRVLEAKITSKTLQGNPRKELSLPFHSFSLKPTPIPFSSRHAPNLIGMVASNLHVTEPSGRIASSPAHRDLLSSTGHSGAPLLPEQRSSLAPGTPHVLPFLNRTVSSPCPSLVPRSSPQPMTVTCHRAQIPNLSSEHSVLCALVQTCGFKSHLGAADPQLLSPA